MARPDTHVDPRDQAAGLCAGCRHVAVQATQRGGRFYRCRRADVDDRFARYPRLPVVTCPGWEPKRGPGDRPDRA